MNALIFLMTCLFTTSIYTVQFQNIDGGTVSMSQYQGKKILIVNIATGSSKVNQLAGLQQLQQQYGDSLVVIGFPSNSFGKESRSNAEIKQFCQSNYGVSFLLASKNPVSGAEIQPVYNWLTSISQNGIIGDTVLSNFQKFLINQSGQLVGVFGPSVDPMSQEMINAITQ
jgi:glutathione peroxidase